MADKPVIVVDTREQAPWTFGDMPIVRRGLSAGDYSIEGYETTIAIERKSIADLVGTLTTGRDRFERELEKLATYKRAAIFVEGVLSDVIAGRYRSQVSPKAIVGSLGSFFGRYGIATVFCGAPNHAAHLAASYLHKAAKYVAREEAA